jgi:hypothetical protein
LEVKHKQQQRREDERCTKACEALNEKGDQRNQGCKRQVQGIEFRASPPISP